MLMFLIDCTFGMKDVGIIAREDTPFVQLKIRVGKSLETSLARLRKKLQEEEEKRKEEASNVDGTVATHGVLHNLISMMSWACGQFAICFLVWPCYSARYTFSSEITSSLLALMVYWSRSLNIIVPFGNPSSYNDFLLDLGITSNKI